MSLIIKLFMFLCLVFESVLGQERIRQAMVGPNGDQVRIVIAFIEPSPESYRMQSLIIDLNPPQGRKEQPLSFQVDLTSTVRSLSTGEKKQKILLLRWKEGGEIELKCDGKWAKQDTGSAIDNVVEATKAVIQSVHTDMKTPTEVTLSQEVEQKVTSILNALDTENFPCLRNLN